MTLLAILATIFGLINGFSAIPQAIKIFKRRSAKDISIITYSLILLGVIVWFFYGIELGNLPLILTNAAGTITVSIVIIGWSLYK